MNRTILILAALVGVVAGIVGSLAYDRLIPGGGDRAATEQVVHDYLLAHPEILPEAIGRLQSREASQAVAANRPAIVDPFGSAWAGNPKGDVTVVEYFDYNCGFCRASLPTIAKLIAADPKVRVVFRDYPVLSDASFAAAKMSLAAAQAGKWKPFHDALYAAGPVSQATLDAAARAAGFDPVKLAAAGETPAILDQIRSNLSTGRAIGASGTPAWVIGDQVISGAISLDQMQDAVKAARS